MLASGAAPVPALPPNVAPPPRLVKPDATLVVVDVLRAANGAARGRVRFVGFRSGRPMPAETAWEGDADFLDRDSPLFGQLTDGWQRLVAGRHLVTGCGGVFDLREKKVLNAERRGLWAWCDEKKVAYSVEDPTRVQGRFTFEYATGTLTRTGSSRKGEWAWTIGAAVELSPNREMGVEWRGCDELILHRKGREPKSLGKGFTLDVPRKWARFVAERSWGLPILWLDDERLLTQRGNGKLVTVDLSGRVEEVATIKAVPKVTEARLFRDGSGTIVYEAGDHHAINLAKRTAEKSEWQGLGHGFAVSWEWDEKRGHRLRHNGKEIGRFRCDPDTARAAPGYLAICKDGEPDEEEPHTRGPVVVWSASTGAWTTVPSEVLQRTPIPGWLK
jgi:hypothetical protein